MSEVTAENEGVAKKPISEKQRLANIANSRCRLVHAQMLVKI